MQLGIEYGVNNKLGKPSRQVAYDILHKAHSLGIDTLDTAENYGESHSIIADFHKQVNYKFKIITKYSKNTPNLGSDIVARMKQHCNNFNVQKLSGYMFHSYSDFKESLIENPNILKKLKSSNYAEKIGVSVYTNKEIEAVLNYKEITFIQLPFNLFDNDSKRGEILRKAKQKGLEIHTRSAFLQGLYFKDPDSLQGKLVDLKTPLKKMHKFVFENSLDIATLSLKYPLEKIYIDNVLIGVDSVEQLEKNISSIKIKYSDLIYKTIDMTWIENDNLLNPALWKQ